MAWVSAGDGPQIRAQAGSAFEWIKGDATAVGDVGPRTFRATGERLLAVT